MINLYGLELKKLQKLLENYEQKPYRAVQLYTWIYEKKVTSFDEMSDISLATRKKLKEKFSLSPIWRIWLNRGFIGVLS